MAIPSQQIREMGTPFMCIYTQIEYFGIIPKYEIQKITTFYITYYRPIRRPTTGFRSETRSYQLVHVVSPVQSLRDGYMHTIAISKSRQSLV